MAQKRQVPPFLQKVMAADIAVSKRVFTTIDTASRCVTQENYRLTLKALELSGNGLIWLGVCTASIFLFGSSWTRNLCLNLLIALLLDLVVVAVLKALVRRRRPREYVDTFYTVQSIDKFSFPSGHATRAVMLVCLLCHQYSLRVMSVPLCVWGVSVCLGRLAMRRHYLLDVSAGAAIGYLEACVVVWLGLWLSHGATDAIVAYFLDQAPQGASYDE